MKTVMNESSGQFHTKKQNKYPSHIWAGTVLQDTPRATSRALDCSEKRFKILHNSENYHEGRVRR